MTLVLDYEAGNLRSVENALRFLGAEYRIIRKPDEAVPADRLIFPGVGEAASAMARLKETGLDAFLHDFVATGKPFLGICLGSQIILEHSEESDTVCLGIIRGSAMEFPESLGLKIPHMGWNSVHFDLSEPIFEGIPDGSDFYFVHSFYPAPAEESAVLATSEYGMAFPAGLKDGNVYAFQFHLEKSGPRGLRLLSNFLSMKAGDAC